MDCWMRPGYALRPVQSSGFGVYPSAVTWIVKLVNVGNADMVN